MKRDYWRRREKRGAHYDLTLMRGVWAIVVLLVLVGFLGVLAQLAHAQRQNVRYAAEYPGASVAAKVTAAQADCNPNASIPCVIVIDATLATASEGTLPTPCAQCIWKDYRVAGSERCASNASPALAACGGGGGGSGTVTASPQYQLPYYSAAGTASTVTGTPNLVTNASGQFGLQLGAGSLADVAFMKFGALAANQNNGTGKPIIALAHTANDTNFPGIQYVFGFEDDSVATMTNSGANNAGYVNFRAAVGNSGLASITAFMDENYRKAGANTGTLYGFYSQPTNNGTAATGTRYAIAVYDSLGNAFNKQVGLWINNLANSGTKYAIQDDCLACTSWISNSISIGGQQNSFALTNDKLTVFGHFGIGTFAASAGNKPTIATNACGSTTQGTVSGADSLGTITVGTTAVTSCALTFNQAFASAPTCFVEFQDGTTGIGHGVSTTTAVLTISLASDASSKKIGYHCITPVVN